mgnify:CR=1 FL=1
MGKLSRKQLRDLIIKEIKKMEEDAIVARINPGVLSRHDDPGRQMMYTACSECGSKMYEGDKGVCEQCSSKMYEGNMSSCSECGSKMYEGDKICEQCGYSVYESEMRKDYLNEGACGCGSCGTCNNDGTDYSLDSMKIVGDALHTLNNAGYNVDATKRKDYKIGNHKIYKGSYMAKSHLYKVNKYAAKLYHMIPDGHNLEDWMRTKLAQIADDIGEVYHALDHDKFEGDI